MPTRGEPCRVAIIDNSIMPDVYRPVEHWSGALPPESDWQAFSARRHVFPNLRHHTHVILTGSEASILEPDPWVLEEADVVREAVERGLPVLGSCWGHQLLAFALAGPEHVARSSRPEIGWIRLRLTGDNDLLGRASETPATFSIHFDEVRDVGRAFDVLASSEGCPIQAMQLRGRPVWGLQGHPEVDVTAARQFLRDLADLGFKGRDEILEALSSPPLDSGLIHKIIPAFLRHRAPA